MRLHWHMALLASLGLAGGAQAQERVVAAKDAEALFHSSDPKLDANKQVVYHVENDLLWAGHWELADKYMTARYIQHNPNFPSGRAEIAKIMGSFGPPRPIPSKLDIGVVTVVAEGDYVIVSNAQELPDPRNPGKTYTTTHFDMWRLKDGKVDEHWDNGTLGGPGGPKGEPEGAPRGSGAAPGGPGGAPRPPGK